MEKLGKEMQSVLTLEMVLEIANKPADEIYTLSITSTNIEKIAPEFEELRNIRKLIISGNKLVSLKGLFKNSSLKFLDASHNSLKGEMNPKWFKYLDELFLLNLSHNKIRTMSRVFALGSLSENLQVLILNNNKISSLEGIGNLTGLRSLILKNNRITDVPEEELFKLRKLQKLNLSYNNLRKFPNVFRNCKLAELRLNGNRIMRVDPYVPFSSKLKMLTHLKTLELGKNLFFDFRSLVRVLRDKMPNIKNLNISGNEFQDIADPVEIRDILLDSFKYLVVLNSRKVKAIDESGKAIEIDKPVVVKNVPPPVETGEEASEDRRKRRRRRKKKKKKKEDRVVFTYDDDE